MAWKIWIWAEVLSNLLQGVDTHVVITHQHIDHYALLPSLLTAGANIQNVIIGGADTARTTLNDPRVPARQYLYNPGAFQLPATIEDVFGPNSVEFLLPSQWPGEHEHDQNIVVKVRYRGRGLLFPGDASGTLLEWIITEQPKCLDDIDFMLLSHHGSNGSGELAWFTYVLTRLIKRTVHSILTIVSSNPRGEHCLPPNGVQGLSCSDGVDYCVPRYITVRGSFLRMGVRKAIFASELIEIREPIFTTCNSSTGYYKVIVFDTGDIALQDGDNDPLFLGVFE